MQATWTTTDRKEGDRKWVDTEVRLRQKKLERTICRSRSLRSGTSHCACSVNSAYHSDGNSLVFWFQRTFQFLRFSKSTSVSNNTVRLATSEWIQNPIGEFQLADGKFVICSIQHVNSEENDIKHRGFHSFNLSPKLNFASSNRIVPSTSTYVWSL